MQISKINGRWTIDATAFQNLEVYEQLIFRLFLKVKLKESPKPEPVFNTFKFRAKEIKEKYNYKFPATERLFCDNKI